MGVPCPSAGQPFPSVRDSKQPFCKKQTIYYANNMLAKPNMVHNDALSFECNDSSPVIRGGYIMYTTCCSTDYCNV
ncbi:unnamed protein product [Rotaria sordida]|uniref:Activin types I and II receptor domain-containing protein n=1 Tax=Rotaria sordida TaxID=392033 RepID=A0A819HNP8_9BILA|nr:unnamed protein product [Rotaria sordida]CAF3901165.1 unnamed protein product [Rotaria sordida]